MNAIVGLTTAITCPNPLSSWPSDRRAGSDPAGTRRERDEPRSATNRDNVRMAHDDLVKAVDAIGELGTGAALTARISAI